MELRKFINETIREYLNEQDSSNNSNYITLSDLYRNDYPDDNELIWEYVSRYEFDKTKFKIIEINVNEYFKPYEKEMSNINSNQKKIIKQYIKNIDNILNTIIVVNSYEKRVVDGYHRLAAFALSNINIIHALDLSEEL